MRIFCDHCGCEILEGGRIEHTIHWTRRDCNGIRQAAVVLDLCIECDAREDFRTIILGDRNGFRH